MDQDQRRGVRSPRGWGQVAQSTGLSPAMSPDWGLRRRPSLTLIRPSARAILRGQKRMHSGGHSGGRGGAACSLLPGEVVVPQPSGPRAFCLLTPTKALNTRAHSRLSPGGLLPPTPETTRCSADLSPNSRGGWAADKACKSDAGLEGRLPPHFLSSLLCLELQTARGSLEAHLGLCGILVLGLGISPHCGQLV